jgi:putative polyhydroxyalkanoate system protein
MQLKLAHNQTKAAAMVRVKKALMEHRAQILQNTSDVEERWDGDTLHFAATVQGTRLSGSLTVLEREFDIELKLPLMYRMFEGRIKKAIEEQAKGLLK